MQRAVDGDNVTLCKHLLEVVDPAAANLLLLLRREWLVVEVEELLAVEWLQPAEYTLTDAADSDGADDLVLEIVLVLRNGGNIPLAALDLLVSGDEIADESENSHDHVLSDGHNVGSSDLSNSDTTVGGVCSIEINMVGADTSSDGDLEVLRLRETLCGEVARMETGCDVSISQIIELFE